MSGDVRKIRKIRKIMKIRRKDQEEKKQHLQELLQVLHFKTRTHFVVDQTHYLLIVETVVCLFTDLSVTCLLRVRNFIPSTSLRPKLVTRFEHSFTCSQVGKCQEFDI